MFSLYCTDFLIVKITYLIAKMCIFLIENVFEIKLEMCQYDTAWRPLWKKKNYHPYWYKFTLIFVLNNLRWIIFHWWIVNISIPVIRPQLNCHPFLHKFCVKQYEINIFPVINPLLFYLLLCGIWTATPFCINLHLFSYWCTYFRTKTIFKWNIFQW